MRKRVCVSRATRVGRSRYVVYSYKTRVKRQVEGQYLHRVFGRRDVLVVELGQSETIAVGANSCDWTIVYQALHRMDETGVVRRSNSVYSRSRQYPLYPYLPRALYAPGPPIQYTNGLAIRLKEYAKGSAR